MKKLLFLVFMTGVIFLIKPLAAQNNQGKPPLDGVYEKVHVGQREPVPYPSLRQADVMWSKRVWRVIDLRQKINLPFYYPVDDQQGRKSLMQVIYNAVKEGTIAAYSPDNEEFLTRMSAQELKRTLDKEDTIRLVRDYPPYDEFDSVISEPFRASDVYMIRIKEDWFFDKQRSVMDVRIIGICPILEDYDLVTGELRGLRPLFWVYFPECRQVFAKNEVYNRWNDAERRSYDDIFMKRLFGSYIYKESNVYDRRIAAYSTGLDALLESERIKDEIFRLEHDLWEY
jgi:gliding motility associated protien GldN